MRAGGIHPPAFDVLLNPRLFRDKQTSEIIVFFSLQGANVSSTPLMSSDNQSKALPEMSLAPVTDVAGNTAIEWEVDSKNQLQLQSI